MISGMDIFPLIAAAVVGAALSVSGAVLQSVLRNPLAEPYMLGMVGGGALLAAIVTVTGVVAIGSWVLPLASFIGSCMSLGLVGLVAALAARARRERGVDFQSRSTHSTVILAGFAVGGVMGSLDMLVLSMGPDDAFVRVSKWLYGSLAEVSFSGLVLGLMVAALAFLAVWSCRRELDVMELGHEEAECLGVNTRKTMAISIGAVAVATSVSVALAGAVGFVGLVVPHFVRRVFGVRMKILLPCSAIFGALALVGAQVIASFLPKSPGVGVIAAVFGGPFFLYLLASKNNGEGSDI